MKTQEIIENIKALQYPDDVKKLSQVFRHYAKDKEMLKKTIAFGYDIWSVRIHAENVSNNDFTQAQQFIITLLNYQLNNGTKS